MEITDSANKFHFDLMLPRCSGDMTHSTVSIAGKERNNRNAGFQICFCSNQKSTCLNLDKSAESEIFMKFILNYKKSKEEVKKKYAFKFGEQKYFILLGLKLKLAFLTLPVRRHTVI